MPEFWYAHRYLLLIQLRPQYLAMSLQHSVIHIEMIQATNLALHMMSILMNELVNEFVDNKSVIELSTWPEATLSKKQVCY